MILITNYFLSSSIFVFLLYGLILWGWGLWIDTVSFVGSQACSGNLYFTNKNVGKILNHWYQYNCLLYYSFGRMYCTHKYKCKCTCLIPKQISYYWNIHFKLLITHYYYYYKKQQHRNKWENQNCLLIAFATPQTPSPRKTEKQNTGKQPTILTAAFNPSKSRCQTRCREGHSRHESGSWNKNFFKYS